MNPLRCQRLLSQPDRLHKKASALELASALEATLVSESELVLESASELALQLG